MELQRLIHLRPWLYHLTATSNLDRIRSTRCLFSAASIYEQAGQRDALRARRKRSDSIVVNGDTVIIRDQQPLHAGNMALSAGVGFEDFVAYLNRHVFFWPGDDDGPIGYGRRHFARYAGEDCHIVKVRTVDLIAANRDTPLLVSRCNSGSPRWSGGRAAPRGLATFVLAELFEGTAGRVVEVVFRNEVRLPGSTQYNPAQ